MQKIPFHIISGFLGSGKTTFLKRIIENYSSNLKLGIVQNEFAPSSIDGAELKSSNKNFKLLEINNGSVFCVCLLGDFVRSLENFIDEHQPDMLIIEASGLSDTTSIAEVVAAGKLAEKIYLATNWCIVDAVNFEKSGLMKQRIIHQVRMADVVLVNKTDLLKSTGFADNIAEEVKQVNPFASIRFTQYCAIDFDPELQPINKFYMNAAQPLPRPKVNSMVIKSGKKLSQQSLTEFLNEWAPIAYRIKGFVNLKEGGTVAVQCVREIIKTRQIENHHQPTELIALSDEFTLREWNKSFRGIK